MKYTNCIEVSNLNKTFYLDKKGISIKDKLIALFSRRKRPAFKALTNINLEVKKGEFLGIIGHNGSGKSTLLKLIIGAMDADEGSIIKTKGKIIRLALGLGFDPNLTARDNIYLNGTILGLSFKKIGKKFDEIIDFAGIEKFVDTPIKFYSSGMASKLSFAIAMHAEADIFLIDEFFSDVGDEAFKQKSQKAFENNIIDGKTIIHVTHSLSLIDKRSDRILILENGNAKMYDNPNEALNFYLGKR